MINNTNILIINTGGTFNKQYNELTGKLDVLKSNKIIKKIFKKAKIKNIKIKGLIYKDSLDITNKDRKKLAKYIIKSDYEKIIIIHGTDTMNKTAKYLNKKIKNKKIILTGALKPFSIKKVEAVANLMSGYGYLLGMQQNMICISMHSLVVEHIQIKKNYTKGIFECH